MGSLRSTIDARLCALAPAEDRTNALSQAIRYALLAPGKRIRPLLVLLASRECGGKDRLALDAACAVEMVHAASLVLDDLPAMDDAATRRGRSSTHVVFGEDVAILASISLLGSAFRAISGAEGLDAACRTRIVAILAQAIGHEGLSAGQHADLSRTAALRPVERIVETNHRKTGSLFIAAAEIAAVVAGADSAGIERLSRYAGHLGQAFQLLDDLDDGEDGSGEDSGKATLVTIVGRADVRARLDGHLRQALAPLDPDGELAQFTRGIFDAGLRQEAGVGESALDHSPRA